MLGQKAGCWPHLSFRPGMCVRTPRRRQRSLVRPGQPVPRLDGCQGLCCCLHAEASRFISLPSAVREPDWLPTALGSLCNTHESRGQRVGAVAVLQEGRKVACDYKGAAPLLVSGPGELQKQPAAHMCSTASVRSWQAAQNALRGCPGERGPWTP